MPDQISYRSLGRAIAQRRLELGLSQEALAEAADLGQSAMSRIESADRKLESLELVALVTALDCTVTELLDRARTISNETTSGSALELLALRGDSQRVVEALSWIGKVREDLDYLESLLLDE